MLLCVSEGIVKSRDNSNWYHWQGEKAVSECCSRDDPVETESDAGWQEAKGHPKGEDCSGVRASTVPMVSRCEGCHLLVDEPGRSAMSSITFPF